MMQEGMYWGLGYGHIFMVVIVALIVAALVKYVFFR